MRRLLAMAGNYDYAAIIALGGLQGLRISEILGLRCEHFDIERMTIRVRGKGDKTRVIPMSRECFDAIAPAFLRAQILKQPLVCLSDSAARSAVTSLGRRAGLQRAIASHDLRATFATHLYDQTKDIRLVQEFMGHSDSHTTETYIAVKMSNMEKAVNFA